MRTLTASLQPVTTHGSSSRTGLRPLPIYVMITPFHAYTLQMSEPARHSKDIKYMPRRTRWPPLVALPLTIYYSSPLRGPFFELFPFLHSFHSLCSSTPTTSIGQPQTHLPLCTARSLLDGCGSSLCYKCILMRYGGLMSPTHIEADYSAGTLLPTT